MADSTAQTPQDARSHWTIDGDGVPVWRVVYGEDDQADYDIRPGLPPARTPEAEAALVALIRSQGEPVEQAQPTYEWAVVLSSTCEPVYRDNEEACRQWLAEFGHTVSWDAALARSLRGPWEKVT